MDLKATAKEIHENAAAKGFWDKERNLGEMLCLVHSEISEAMEADREDKYYDPETRYRVGKDLTKNGSRWSFEVVDNDNEAWQNWFRSEVKNTFADELADAVIRILDICHHKGIDLEWHIQSKMKFNSMRPHMHGKKY